MVKGVSRRVVVVQPDTHDLFEQAIFLVRDYSAPRSALVREACKIANGYLVAGSVRRKRRFSGGHVIAAFAAGIIVACVIWSVSILLF